MLEARQLNHHQIIMNHHHHHHHSAQTNHTLIVSNFLLQQRAVAQLRDALAMIPQQQQAEYREALYRCPHLVETESDPMQFLLFADFNAWSAAERLVMYWSKRKDVFGERAFRSLLDLSGNGALTTEDVQLIQTGSFLLTADDTVVVDRSLEPVDVEYSVETQIRRGFFIFQLLTMSRSTATPGKGCTYVVRLKRFKSMNKRVASVTTELWKTAFPIRIKAVHLVFVADFQLGFIQNFMSSLCNLWGMSFSSHLILHHCKTPEQALMDLIPHGILPAALPPSLGGNYQPSVEFIRFLTHLRFPMTTQSMRNNSIIWTGHEPVVVGEPSDTPDQERATTSSSGSVLQQQQQREIASSSPSTVDTKADVIDRGLNGLNEAIDLLPDKDKMAYLQALQQAPEIVKEESPPLVFLQFENFDTWAAATRLCNYWTHRVEVFEDRAFLPMTLKGALGPDGEKALEVGMYYLHQNDASGRAVWCAESLRKMSSDPEMDYKMRSKMYYYLAYKVLKHPNSLRDGVVGIVLIREIEIPIIDSRWRANLLRSGKMFKESFPIKSASMQLVLNPSGGTILSTVFVNFFLRLYAGFFGEPQNIHFCTNNETREQMFQKCEAAGISREGLSKILNGNEAALEFLSRQRMEESRVVTSNPTKVTKSAIHEMQTALSNIENINKGAYLEALGKAPDLAEQESLWEGFLRFTNCDATKAASMLVKYWEMRKEVFGNRAFLPMNQTFEGALERKDVAVLQTGYMMQLPCVKSGDSVLYCDGTKLQKSSSTISRARCKFYILSIMSENAISQTRGFNLLYFSSDPSFDRAFKESFFEKILPVMPIRVQHVHILGLNLGPANADDLVEARLNETKSIFDLRRTVGMSSVDTHIGTSREDLLRGLVRHGFSKEGLPKAVCGALGYDDFVKWQELRVRYEWGLFTNSREQEISSTYLIPRNKLILNEEESEKSERKRRMTIILSRRKRERERMALEELQEEAMEHSERHRKLKRQNETLHQLIEQANAIVKGKSA